MHNVCKDCFSDKEIIGLITSQANIGNCDFCDKTNIEVINISELLDFFKELLDNFQHKGNGENLKVKIQGNWNLFSNLDSAYKVLNYVIQNIDTEITNADELVDFNNDILENVNYWNILKDQLKWEKRYLTNINILTDDLGWDSFFNSQIVLNHTSEFFRARLHHIESENPYENEKMYCPPKGVSTAGRANPAGIPFLYLSDNKETILYEIRASYLDEISIGTFSLKNTITNEIKISDFTENQTIFHPNKVNEKIKSTLLKRQISHDLSKPMRRYDSELDYIPTQFICEFIKIFTGVHGIKFRSSLHTTGNNLVIFDQNIMECKSVEKVKIKKVKITA
ncbi:MAG: RES family NAD+ phosphorylase [Bacteroidia bacterium]